MRSADESGHSRVLICSLNVHHLEQLLHILELKEDLSKSQKTLKEVAEEIAYHHVAQWQSFARCLYKSHLLSSGSFPATHLLWNWVTRRKDVNVKAKQQGKADATKKASELTKMAIDETITSLRRWKDIICKQIDSWTNIDKFESGDEAKLNDMMKDLRNQDGNSRKNFVSSFPTVLRVLQIRGNTQE